jgi:hypothetical protein
MGRSSVDATKACLIFAVRADLAPRAARLAGFLPFAVGLAGVLVGFGFEVADAAALADGAEELAGLCAGTGSAAISVESTHARQRVKMGAGVGEVAALMFPL